MVGLPKPYFQDEWTTIYNADCRDILPLLSANSADLVLTDPPYGIAHPTDYRHRGRGKLATCRNYPPVYGDNQPFDPELVLSLNIPTVLWGANYFADRLPASGGWLVWDKERPDDLDQATCEVAWTNFVAGIRRFRFMWHGMLRASDEQLVHPTQKPVALMRWVLCLKWTPTTGIVLDPYMGSGPVLIAAKSLGRKSIGIEIEERYCEIAARRLAQMPMIFEPVETAPEPEQRQLDLQEVS